MDFKKWMTSVVSKVRSICREFVEEKEIISDLLTKDKLCVWANVFTHISHRLDRTYETLEHVGDRICDWAFQIYLRDMLGVLPWARDIREI